MLKQRILTAVLLIPLVLWLILAASTAMCALCLGIVLLLAAWEWGKLIPLKSKASQGLYCALLCLVLSWLYLNSESIDLFKTMSTMSLLLLAGCFLAVISYPATRKLWAFPPMIILAGILLLSNCWWSLMWLKQTPHGDVYLIYLLLIIWAADIGAYLVGKLWGKHKLIPRVSPGKTYEGVLGGIFFSIIIILVTGYWFDIAVIGWGPWLIVGILTALSSVLGDLLVSMLKRNVGLKDTGSLLPGHGGILDRIDSLLAAAVLFTDVALAIGIIQS